LHAFAAAHAGRREFGRSSVLREEQPLVLAQWDEHAPLPRHHPGLQLDLSLTVGRAAGQKLVGRHARGAGVDKQQRPLEGLAAAEVLDDLVAVIAQCEDWVVTVQPSEDHPSHRRGVAAQRAHGGAATVVKAEPVLFAAVTAAPQPQVAGLHAQAGLQLLFPVGRVG
jgi:hypothetical protein